MTATVDGTARPLIIAPRMAVWGNCSADFDDGSGWQGWSAPADAMTVTEVYEDLQAWMLAVFGATLEVAVMAGAGFPRQIRTVASPSVQIDNASSDARALLGWPVGLDAMDQIWDVSGLITGRSGGLANWRQETQARSAAAQGAPSPLPPGTAPYLATLRGAIAAAEMPYALVALQRASSPRTALVWDAGDEVWRDVSFGPVRVERASPGLHVLSAEVRG